jgi:hypothetical protein
VILTDPVERSVAISIMQLTTGLVALSLATFAAAGWYGQQVLEDPKPKVPGSNPLTFCQATDNYLLQVDYVDLTPNPPLAFVLPLSHDGPC